MQTRSTLRMLQMLWSLQRNHNQHYHQQNHTLKQHTNCNTANVIYLLTCAKSKQQYVGETANAVQFRANQHRSDITVGTKQLPTVRHFRNCGRKLLMLTTIERVRKRDLQTRLARENCWIQRLKPVMNTLL